MKKHTLLFCIFSLIISNLTAQTTFLLSKKNDNIKVSDFYIQKITLKEDVQTLGEVYAQNGKTQKVYLNGNIASGILKYYAKYNLKNKNDAVNIEIEVEKIALNETKTSNTSVEGKLIYEIKVYTLGSNGRKELCNNRNSGKYTRTLNNYNLNNIELQFQNALDNGLIFITKYIQKNKSQLDAFVTNSQIVIKPFKIKNSRDTVYYQQRKVTWKDFLGPIRHKTNYGAAIYTSFGFESKIFTENSTVNIEIIPMVFTDKNMSWAKPAMQDQYGLNHEQLHFDICYLMTLRFLKKIKSFKSNNSDDLISMVQYEYLESFRATHDLQELYDSQTNHSIIKDQQLKWQQKVEKEIKEVNLKEIFDN